MTSGRVSVSAQPAEVRASMKTFRPMGVLPKRRRSVNAPPVMPGRLEAPAPESVTPVDCPPVESLTVVLKAYWTPRFCIACLFTRTRRASIVTFAGRRSYCATSARTLATWSGEPYTTSVRLVAASPTTSTLPAAAVESAPARKIGRSAATTSRASRNCSSMSSGWRPCAASRALTTVMIPEGAWSARNPCASSSASNARCQGRPLISPVRVADRTAGSELTTMSTPTRCEM